MQVSVRNVSGIILLQLLHFLGKKNNINTSVINQNSFRLMAEVRMGESDRQRTGLSGTTA